MFDAKTLAHLQTLALPPHPNSLTLDSQTQALFVTVKNYAESKKAGKAESIVKIQQ